jgi:hypothetical protein
MRKQFREESIKTSVIIIPGILTLTNYGVCLARANTYLVQRMVTNVI